MFSNYGLGIFTAKRGDQSMNPGKEIVIEAESLEAALTKAEEMINMSREKLKIEIVDSGSKGIMGFGKRPTVIRARYRGFGSLEQFVYESLNSRMEPGLADNGVHDIAKIENIDGLLEIKDGQVLITRPVGFGNYPTISPGENAKVYVNGKEIDKPMVVTHEDRIDIRPLSIAPLLSLDVVISTDKLSASVKLRREVGKKYAILDSPPAQVVKVKTDCIEEDPGTLGFDAVMNELQKRGIVYGIDNEAIEQLIGLKGSHLEIEVARGIPPKEGRNGFIEYNLLGEERDMVYNPYGEGKIRSVTAGQILAKLKPPTEGVHGIDVTGKSVPPRKPESAKLLVKEGVKLIEDGIVAVATITGRPVLEGYRQKILTVKPIYYVTGDVDVGVGNISFKGDIVVTGSVLDGFRVEAGGSIEVYGDVFQSSLYALGDVVIHNKAITAKINAGGDSLVLEYACDVLSQLQGRIGSLMDAMVFLRKQPAFNTLSLKEKVDGHLIKLLIDIKYKDIPKLIGKLADILNQGREKHLPQLLELQQELNETFCNLGPLRIQDRIDLAQLLERLENVLTDIDHLITDSANVTVGYAQNCSIIAAGDISITGEGSMISELDAGGQIQVPFGEVRGGKLTSPGKIRVRELGSTSDAEVHIRLLGDCRLEADLAHPGVVIRYGSDTHVVSQEVRHLRAYGKSARLFTNYSPAR